MLKEHSEGNSASVHEAASQGLPSHPCRFFHDREMEGRPPQESTAQREGEGRGQFEGCSI